MFHSQNHAVVHSESMTGQEITAENTANAPLEMRIYGVSQQEQTAEPDSPSPEYPSEIKSAVDFEVGSGNTTATIDQVLRGIPDGSGGWAARDYIEVKDGAVKHIKRIDESLLDETVKLEEQTGVIMATPAITDITSTELGQALSGMKSVQYYTRIYHTSALPVEMEATITKLGRG